MGPDDLRVPDGFKNLALAWETPGGSGPMFNVIGICTWFFEPSQSAGTDMTMAFTLHDPSCFHEGKTARFFFKKREDFPRISNQGDVVVLNGVNIGQHPRQGQYIRSTRSTKWAVLEHASVNDSQNEDGSDIKIHKSGGAIVPDSAVLRYAKAISKLENPQTWPRLVGSTKLDVKNTMIANGGQAPATRDKFKLVKDLDGGMYVDLLGEVRNILPSDAHPKTELYVTDYTVNEQLYDKIPENDLHGPTALDGDSYGYMKASAKKWPGPWGKSNILVNLWDSQDMFARKQIKPSNFVSMQNVYIQVDRKGTKLEGYVREDKMDPGKHRVTIVQPREAESDPRLHALIQRKREYETVAKKKHLPFVRDLQNSRGSDPLKRKQQPSAEDPAEPAMGHKARRNKKKKEKRRAKKGEATLANASTLSTASLDALNPAVRANNVNIPTTAITTILSPTILHRTTPEGNPFTLPFQNSIYKSRVRVVDYFPDRLEDFAAPVRVSDYAILDDNDSDSDVSMADLDNDSGSSAVGDAAYAPTPDSTTSREIRWEWRFCLLVVDDQPQRTKPGEGLLPEQREMELLVSDTDAEYLLRLDASNLRKRPKDLAMLRERLFTLWGDLQERKEEAMAKAEAQAKLQGAEIMGPAVDGGVGYEGLMGEVRSRPFECFIKEYGIPTKEKSEMGDRDGDNLVQGVGEWERMFRLCKTSISV